MITPYKQIYPHQCQALAKIGYQTLINLRLDNECETQPCNDALKKQALEHGLTYHHLPIDGECTLSNDTIQSFATLYNQSPKPVMVFCGTGGRAKRLYQCAKICGLID